MRTRAAQRGYTDNKLPPVFIGVVLVIGVVSYPSNEAQNAGLPAVGVYLAVLLGLAAIAWGITLHIDSLKYPESPFNKHTSSWLIGFVLAAGLGHAAWTAYGGPHSELAYLLVGAIVIALLVMIFCVRRRGDRSEGGGLP